MPTAYFKWPDNI